VGDAVIQQVSGAMRRSLRPADLLCRYGGEEFCILLVGPGPHGTDFGERMRATIETEAGPGVRSIEGLRVTSSFGVAVVDGGNRPATLAELIDQADKALYDAKHSGRNRVVLHQPESKAQLEA
jgi:diguanylate cyclase (GGDEF)-like protein